MTTALFITLLGIGAFASSLFTEAFKKIFEGVGKKYSSNLIALINGLVIGCGGSAVAYFLLKIPFTASNIACIVLMGICVWIGSTIGFDKVKQMVEQISAIKK